MIAKLPFQKRGHICIEKPVFEEGVIFYLLLMRASFLKSFVSSLREE
jgi:hypothetical protein